MVARVRPLPLKRGAPLRFVACVYACWGGGGDWEPLEKDGECGRKVKGLTGALDFVPRNKACKSCVRGRRWGGRASAIGGVCGVERLPIISNTPRLIRLSRLFFFLGFSRPSPWHAAASPTLVAYDLNERVHLACGCIEPCVVCVAMCGDLRGVAAKNARERVILNPPLECCLLAHGTQEGKSNSWAGHPKHHAGTIPR
jgi:hypothetical protein